LRDLSAGALGRLRRYRDFLQIDDTRVATSNHASAASLSEAINKIGAKNRVDAARIARVKGWL
jgi:hypothetical protein